MKEMLKKWASVKPILWLYKTKDGEFYALWQKVILTKRHDKNFDLHDKLALKACIYLLKCIKKGVKPEYTLDEIVRNGLKKGGAK